MSNRSVLFYLYSTANIFGCIWGGIGLIAFFIIKQLLWLYLVPVLYICGYLIAPKNAVSEHWVSGNQLSARDLKNN